ncbi:MAG: signal peptidase II [Spirochaetaceae bacterium]|nr:MAG: signal peptidase II [Spirochaetaceae bacterium]
MRPLVLPFVIVILDQVTKLIIVAHVPLFYQTGEVIPVLGDFLRIIHVRNLGIAFSIGHGLVPWVRRLLFIALPLVVMVLLFVFYYMSSTLTQRQRWLVAGILGGGIGNIIDRIFRPLGVVDFLDVKFYGLFGMDRWPTFNVADAAVVVCGFLLVVSMLLTPETPFHGERDRTRRDKE